jgi:hypothetical protein
MTSLELGEPRPQITFVKLARKAEGEIPIVRPRRRWQDSIKINDTEIGCEYVDWIKLPTKCCAFSKSENLSAEGTDFSVCTYIKNHGYIKTAVGGGRLDKITGWQRIVVLPR